MSFGVALAIYLVGFVSGWLIQGEVEHYMEGRD